MGSTFDISRLCFRASLISKRNFFLTLLSTGHSKISSWVVQEELWLNIWKVSQVWRRYLGQISPAQFAQSCLSWGQNQARETLVLPDQCCLPHQGATTVWILWPGLHQGQQGADGGWVHDREDVGASLHADAVQHPWSHWEHWCLGQSCWGLWEQDQSCGPGIVPHTLPSQSQLWWECHQIFYGKQSCGCCQ